LASEPHDKFIVKPSDGRGSEGVAFFNKSGLVNFYRNNKSNRADDVVQVACEGEEYRCMMIIQEGELALLAPIRRRSFRDTVFLGILSYSDAHYEKIKEHFQKFIKMSGIRNSVIKADVIVSDGTVDVIEADIGVGGGTYYNVFVSRLYGRDMIDEYIRLILGKKIETFAVASPNLRMEYVFNHRKCPVRYDLEECQRMISDKFGNCEIQINQLHPENKGGYCSNADFIMTVIYENAESCFDFCIDEFVNKHLLVER
jgi:hypothetical protein